MGAKSSVPRWCEQQRFTIPRRGALCHLLLFERQWTAQDVLLGEVNPSKTSCTPVMRGSWSCSRTRWADFEKAKLAARMDTGDQKVF